MPDVTDDKKDPDEFDADDPAELKLAERWLSGVLGVMFEVGGVGAIYVSKNQAGTAALVIVGGILLFLAVTGTPIRRAKYGDKEIEFARKRGKAIAEAVKDGPEDIVERATEALERIDPIAAWEVRKSADAAQMSARSYELRLQASLVDILGARGSVREQYLDADIADLLVKKGDELIAIEAKHRSPQGKVSLQDINQAIGFTRSSASPRAIVVSNVRPTDPARTLAEDAGIPVVLWRDRDDDEKLAQALGIDCDASK